MLARDAVELLENQSIAEEDGVVEERLREHQRQPVDGASRIAPDQRMREVPEPNRA
jgi:hypothetical protein